LELCGGPQDGGADRHLSIIALTAREGPATAIAASRRGRDGYVTRPVSAEDLARVMGERLQVSPARAG
jgi:CheY-like chemotaxis protein